MKRTFASLGASFLLAYSTAARADEPLEQLLEQNVVSTASHTSELASDAPATVSVLTDADIRRYGIRSLDEAIDFLAMGLVTQNPLHSVEIGGRGVQLTADYGNHVLLIVDGHVLNEAWDQSAYFEQGFGVPMELIDHIEVMLGPGSVLYGGNAMLAVVNVTTKRAARYAGIRVIAEGTLSPAQSAGHFTSFAPGELGGSYRVGAAAGHVLTLWGRKLEVTAHVERYGQNGPTFTFAPQTATNEDGSPKNFGPRTALGVWGGPVRHAYGTTVTSGYAKAVIGDFTFMTRAAAYDRTTPYTNYLNLSFGDFDGRNRELDRWLSFDARYEKQLTRKLALVLHANLDSYDYQQQVYSSDGNDCSIPTAGPCLYKLVGVARWAGLDGQLTYDWRGDDRLTSLVGASVQGRFVGGKADSQDASSGREMGSVGAHTAYEVPWAVYAQQRWTPLRFVHVNAGARLDDGPRSGAQLSPRAAMSFDVWRGGSIKTLYSQAFRAPNFYETNFESVDEVPAPNLKPETERSIEASLEQRVGRHKLLFGAFRTWWTDMIVLRIRDDGLAQYQNVATIDNYGYNARAEGQLGRLRYGLSMTGAYTRRTTPDGTTPLPVAPQVFGNARASYELPGSLPTIALATTVIGPRLADRALDGGFPSTPGVPAQVRLRLTLTGEVPALKGLSYRIGAEYIPASRSPYVAGPTQFVDPADPAPPRAQLAPINRLTAFAGLQYEL